jgi:hypothetical protein
VTAQKELSGEMYSKQQFASDLLEVLQRDPSTLGISRWAYELYLDRIREFEPGLESVIMDLVLMEEGPEFECTIEELYALANRLSA